MAAQDFPTMHISELQSIAFGECRKGVSTITCEYQILLEFGEITGRNITCVAPRVLSILSCNGDFKGCCFQTAIIVEQVWRPQRKPLSSEYLQVIQAFYSRHYLHFCMSQGGAVLQSSSGGITFDTINDKKILNLPWEGHLMLRELEISPSRIIYYALLCA